VRPRLLALALLALLAACGGGAGGPTAPAARDELVGTADVERLLVTTQQRRSPGLRVGGASCPDQVRLANGTRFTCTVTIEGTRAPYAVTLRDVDQARGAGRFALQPDQPPAALRRQRRVRVDHEDLLGLVRMPEQLHTSPEVLLTST
jgi:Domain of unknown function (DUF4333)